SSRRRHTSFSRDWSSDVCSSDLSYLPWQTENDAQENFNVRAHIGQMLMWKLALDREVRVKNLVTNVASWHADNVVDLTAQSTLKIGRAACREREWSAAGAEGTET